jgi:Protein of unknown function (DUF1761)
MAATMLVARPGGHEVLDRDLRSASCTSSTSFFRLDVEIGRPASTSRTTGTAPVRERTGERRRPAPGISSRLQIEVRMMFDVSYLAIAVAAVAAFAQSSVWYTVFGGQLMELRHGHPDAVEEDRPPAWKMLAELARSLVVAAVLAGLAAQLEIVGWVSAMQLGFVAWIGFPVVLLGGSVLWENVPWKLAVIHVGDWLVKLLLITVIVSVWR